MELILDLASEPNVEAVVPGAAPVVFGDIPDARPDSTASVSDPALSEDDASEFDDGEPVSSYPDDDSGEPVDEVAIETDPNAVENL
jgi:hypothetical protein